jgi:hypothetical protein
LAHDYFVLRPDDEKQHDIAGLNKCWWLSPEEFGDHDALFYESADWSTENKAHKDVIAAVLDFFSVSNSFVLSVLMRL